MGMTIGLLVKIYGSPSPRTIYLLSFPGELLMNMLKMLIIPLIVSSLIAVACMSDPSWCRSNLIDHIAMWPLIESYRPNCNLTSSPDDSTLNEMVVGGSRQETLDLDFQSVIFNIRYQ
ncbi:unnamed protein product [Schistosoma margrebowiei]|uniref:Amino acid transporter n=1 Tax=Schistosoma margrebowiei TaxID=48269 RepID=A0A3P8H3C1_9TREM|nr:unnamed protein product [Schistosoma margrebowiei]